MQPINGDADRECNRVWLFVCSLEKMRAMRVCTALLTAYLIALCATETFAEETTFSSHQVTYRRMIRDTSNYIRLDCYKNYGRRGVVLAVSLAGPTYEKPRHVFTVRIYTMSSCDDIFYFEGDKFRLTYELSKRQTSFRFGFKLAAQQYAIRLLFLNGNVGDLWVSNRQVGTPSDDEAWDKLTDYKYYYVQQSNTIVYLLKHLQDVDSKVEYIQVEGNSEEGKNLINTMPFKTLPVLELTYSGTRISGIFAICRYLASKTNLAPISVEENFNIETVAEQLSIIRAEIDKSESEPDDSKKREMRVKLMENLPFFFKKMEEEVKLRNYLANGKPSWVDLEFVEVVKALFYSIDINLVRYPYLDNLKARVEKDLQDQQRGTQ